MLLGLERRQRKQQRIFEADRLLNGEFLPVHPTWLSDTCIDCFGLLCRDQELRFTVHDSADYYQLKMSIFTDDKRTDLIGEAWIDLKGIIVPGGGQNDMWQTLSCRGKYAGEIRVEITFYDSRPKPDKPIAKAKQITGPVEQETSPSKQRNAMKRRPLPSDPVTGEAPALPPVAAPPADHHQTPPRGHAKQPSHSGYLPNQSPLQAVEYSTPPASRGRQLHTDHYSPSHQSVGHHTPTRVEGPRQPNRPTRDVYETPPRHIEERDYTQKIPISPYDQPDTRGHYSTVSDPYDMSPRDDARHLPALADDRPPPPPAHRPRHNSGGPDILHRNSFDTSPLKSTPPASMRYDVLKNEAHRHTAPSYPGRPTFRGYDSAPLAALTAAPHNSMVHESSGQRHHSYDAYDPHHRSMQPTVEDVPESPPGSIGNGYKRRSARMSHHEDHSYGHGGSGLSRSPGASPGYLSHSPVHTQDPYREQSAYPVSVSPLSSREFTDSPGELSYHSHSSQSQRPSQRSELEATHIQSSPSYGLPTLPPSLTPGVDPNLTQDNSNRMYDERRHESRYSSQALVTQTRDRQRSEPLPTYHTGPSTSPQPYNTQPYERRSRVSYSGAPEPQRLTYRSVSPNPQPNPEHTIRRKSVSPAPPLSESRRLSDIPYGPDSYDAFNPSRSGSRDGTPGMELMDPHAKIVTYDGREIDPSDHLPVESWAPEPEAKQRQAAIESRSRPALAGAQPMPPSSRRAPRTSRVQPVTSGALQLYGHPEDTRTPPVNSGQRGRLQKKQPRASIGHSPSASTPLAQISPDNFQDRQSPYTPTRGAPRGSNWEYPNENNVPPHYGGGHGPPIPAKVPLPLMSGANGGAGDQLALMEEMQRIDIGTGRSRRRGGY